MAEALRSALLGAIPHGFSDRAGLAADDILPGGRMALARQVHSPDVLVVDERWQDGAAGDALVTARRGVVLGIVTADCVPVLLADPAAGVVAAAHAGWRGAQAGVIENTLAAMAALGARPDRILAAIGPAIRQPSYEVDAALRTAFGAAGEPFFAPARAGHWQFDLPGLVAARLRAGGVAAVEDLGLDTYADPARFHSYRRATQAGAPCEGRQLSAIARA